MSWLAAARNFVLEMLASSAWPLACASAMLSRVSSSVRSRTRRFERLVGARQRLGGFDARRDVGEGRDEAAVRHAVGAHLDHQAALGEALAERLAAGEIAIEPRADRVIDRFGVAAGAPGIVAQDFVEPGAAADQARRQVENVAELPVPADQSQILVEHRDALPHVVERGLQDFAVVLDRRVGVVEQLERRLGRDRALAQQERQRRAATTPRRWPRRATCSAWRTSRKSASSFGSRLMRWRRGEAPRTTRAVRSSPR